MNKVEKFSKNHTIIFSIIVILVAMLVWNIEWDNDPYMGFDLILSHSITCLLAVWLMWAVKVLKSAGFGCKGLGKGLLLGMPLFVLGIGSTLLSNLKTDWTQLGSPNIRRTLLFTFSMFMVGAAEELLFRGLILNNMLKKWGRREGVWKSVIVSSAVFGAIHLLNMAVAPPLTVIIQAINAAAAGMMFCAIYIRCRNMWAVIITHMIVDWLSLFLDQCFSGATSIISAEVSILQGILTVLVGVAVPVVFSIIYIKKDISFAVKDQD